MTLKIAVLSLMFALFAPVYGAQLAIDSREDWDMIIEQLYSGQGRNQEFLHEARELVVQKAAAFSELCDRVDRRIGELEYLLRAQNVENVFAVTIYSKQINDLRNSFDRMCDKLNEGIRKIERNQKRDDDVLAQLEKLDLKFLSPENRHKVPHCLEICRSYSKSLRDTGMVLQPLAERIKVLQKRLAALDELATNSRRQSFEEMVFSHRSSLLIMSGTVVMMERHWIAAARDWLVIQTPASKEFWTHFALLLVVGALPLIIAGRYLFRFLLTRMDFPEKYAKENYFMLGWCLLIFSFCLLFSRQMLGEVESTLLFRCGQLLFGAACLTLSLVIRLDRKTMRQTLLLYTPVMLQYFGGMVMSLTVAGYVPLLFMLFVLNIALGIMSWWLLVKTECTHLDRYLGIMAILLSFIAAALALAGFAYFAFSITSIWYIVLAGLQTGVAITAIIRGYVEQNRERRIFNCLLMTLMTPACWLVVVGSLIYWMASMYNAESVIRQLMFARITFLHKYLDVNFMDILVCLLAALLLSFLLSTFRNIIAIIFGDQAQQGLIPSFMTLGTYVAWGLYVIFAMMLFHVEPSGILVVLGGMSMGIGFGMKDIVENFFSGIILLVGKQLRPGDIIEFNGSWGKVRKVSIRATVVDTFDNAVITYPNSDVLSKNFRNWTLNHSLYQADIKVTVKVPVGEIPRIKELLMLSVKNNTDIQSVPPPEVLFTDFTKDGLVFVVRCSMDAEYNARIQSRIREEIGRVFNENNVAIAC